MTSTPSVEAAAPDHGPSPEPFSPAACRALEILSAIYIAMPFLIYSIGWLRPVLAWPLAAAYAAALAWGCWKALQWSRAQPRVVDTGSRIESPYKRLGLLVLLAAAIVACSGVGALTFRFADYVIYDSIRKALIDSPWPYGMVFEMEDGTTQLMPGAYYWAYHLPAALAGKLFGWEAAFIFQYFWVTLGLVLVLAWFMRILGVFRLRFAFMFIFFAGLDLIGYLITTPLPDGDPVTWWDYLTGTFWWSTGPGWMAHWTANYSLLTPEGEALAGGVFYRFYGPFSFIFDGVIHVFPGWIILLTAMHDVLRRKTLERTFLLTAILPLCSVFVTMGTLPFLALAAWHTRLRGLLTVGNCIVGPIIVLMLVLQYQSVESDIVSGWLWEFQNPAETKWYLLLYYFVSFGIMAMVAPSMRGDGFRPGRVWFYGALAVFLAAPWYRMGVFNDFTTKVVIPSQLVFMVCLATSILRPEGMGAEVRKKLLIACLFIAAWSGTGILHRAVNYGFGFSPPPKDRVIEAGQEFRQRDDQDIIHTSDTFFWRHLAKPVDYQPMTPNPATYELDFTDPGIDPEEWDIYAAAFTKTDAGFVFRTQANEPLLRHGSLVLDTSRIGSVEVTHTVEDQHGNTPDHRLVLQWADTDLIAQRGDFWPFHRWYSAIIYPDEGRIPLNAYWRGETRQITIFFAMDGDPDEEYTVTLSRITFRQR